jgi:hypothetical protein
VGRAGLEPATNGLGVNEPRGFDANLEVLQWVSLIQSETLNPL